MESVSGNTVRTIEGNSFSGGVSQVARRSYHKYAGVIQGYARPRYGHAAGKKGLSLADVTREVIQGKWGNGDERINRLKRAGYNPQQVQKEMNRQLQVKPFETVVQEVIAGKHGNGADRVKAIKSLGHNPEKVQAEVNKRLKNQQQVIKQAPVQHAGGGKPITSKETVEVDGIVYEVIMKEK